MRQYDSRHERHGDIDRYTQDDEHSFALEAKRATCSEESIVRDAFYQQSRPYPRQRWKWQRMLQSEGSGQNGDAR